MKISTKERKKFRVRNKLKKFSNSDRLRLSIFRSTNNISAQIIDDNREVGKSSLRRAMWKKALNKDNTNMQIFLSKNVLGMKEKVETQSLVEPLPLIIDGKAEDVEEVK